MNTNDFYELKKSYDTSQMPEKEVIKMKERIRRKPRRRTYTIKPLSQESGLALPQRSQRLSSCQILHRVSPMRWNRSHCLEI